MLPSARKDGKKRQQDTLCKLLAETKYQVFNITNAANTFYDTGIRVLFLLLVDFDFQDILRFFHDLETS
ncbi:hypothetical protein TVAGG3_0230080 [Trichomonas vaginalis G3]|uniref:hypothetical protein n=1 Tax=Trichomonas vaginalis (strain ATCC PRA-98 / G3) TaxID=412133 RepID=UPI0021E60912|nr:hypothetical protein TVAGG3_0230080 [Trichomonas vaginalis G3]KAI5552561.1 hypothetical protein TVAGG3_0230080 [Trichomonas vaginalis G3]